MKELSEEFAPVEHVFRKYSSNGEYSPTPENEPLLDKLWELFTTFKEQNEQQPISSLQLHQYVIFIIHGILNVQNKADIKAKIECRIGNTKIIGCVENLHDICYGSQTCKTMLKEIQGRFLNICSMEAEKPLLDVGKKEFLLQYKSGVEAQTEKLELDSKKQQAIQHRDRVIAFCARYGGIA